jgi:hypothetical protein
MKKEIKAIICIGILLVFSATFYFVVIQDGTPMWGWVYDEDLTQQYIDEEYDGAIALSYSCKIFVKTDLVPPDSGVYVRLYICAGRHIKPIYPCSLERSGTYIDEVFDWSDGV